MMTRSTVKRTVSMACALTSGALLTGCCALLGCDTTIEGAECGAGTIEQQINSRRTCVVAPLRCGAGAHEQATGGQRECVPQNGDKKLAHTCGPGTHEQEQATGGQRECVPEKNDCDPDEIIVAHKVGPPTCRKAAISCGRGTHEQATGGQRECVAEMRDCVDGAELEQATGGQRECQINE